MPRASAASTRLSPKRISDVSEAEQHDDNRDSQEDVDKASERVGGRKPEHPQNEEDDDEC
jgi:hypothetical protein